MTQVDFEVGGAGMTRRFTLVSLDEYEAAGGEYDDAGNNGEACDRDEFVCAVADDVLVYDDEAEYHEMIDGRESLRDLLDLVNGDYWLDTTVGWWLLRKFPPVTPQAMRLAVAGRIA